MNPSITVIIPVYNVEPYLRRCLDSVLAQTFTDFEVICIDDKSTDSSFKILCEYAEKDNRFQVLQNEHNRGLSFTRNVGLSHAKGKYVYFLDSDDDIVPECLELIQTTAERTNAEIVFFGYREKKGYEKEKLFPIPGYICGKIWNGRELFVELERTSYTFTAAQLKLWKKSFLEKFGLQFYEGIYHEDILFSFSALAHAECVTCLCDILYDYYRNPNSITGQMLTFRHIESLIVVIDEMEKVWELYNSMWDNSMNDAACEYIAYQFNQIESMMASLGLSKLPACSDIFDTRKKNLYIKIRHIASYQYRYVLTDEQLERLKGFDHVIVYGAGFVAGRVIPQLFQNGIEKFKIAVSRRKENQSTFFGLPVMEIAELGFPKEKSIVIVAVGSRIVPEILQVLSNMEYMNIITFEN